MSKKLILGIVLIIIIIWGFSIFSDKANKVNQDQDTNLENTSKVEDSKLEDVAMMMKNAEISGDEMEKEIDGNMVETMMEMTYQYSGNLEDVTGGDSSGVAKANYEDGQYNLLVTFENLPSLVGTDFYEGWIVRKGVNFDVISSGALEKIGDTYINTYASGQDLTDHSFYVLTLEPDDGDPAPAKHILEGTLKK